MQQLTSAVQQTISSAAAAADVRRRRRRSPTAAAVTTAARTFGWLGAAVAEFGATDADVESGYVQSQLLSARQRRPWIRLALLQWVRWLPQR
jgi:hypothetical protein